MQQESDCRVLTLEVFRLKQRLAGTANVEHVHRAIHNTKDTPIGTSSTSFEREFAYLDRGGVVLRRERITDWTRP